MSIIPRTTLVTISTWAEIAAVALTVLGAIAGVIFVFSSRPLRAFEAREKLALQRDLADLTQRNLELEQEIAPRRLTSDQQQKVAKLDRTGATIEVRSYSGDTESLVFAHQIVDSLQRTGFRIIDNRLTLQASGNLIFGVGITGRDQSLVNTLSRILGSLQINHSLVPSRPNTIVEVSYGTAFNRTPPSAVITVGVKPIR